MWWEGHRAGYLLEKKVKRGNEEHGLDLIERWLTGAKAEPSEDRYAQELNWSLNADAFEEGGLDDRGASENLGKLWVEIRDDVTWKSINGHYSLNPHSAGPLIRMLAVCLVRLPNFRDELAARLQELLAFAPSSLPLIAATLGQETWGERWPSLVDQVISSAGGFVKVPEGGTRMEGAGRGTLHQIGAIDLWGQYMRRLREKPSTVPANPSIRELLACLRAAAVLAISDDRAVIANHAANALVVAAEIADEGEECTLLASSLKRIAGDARIAVRAAAAYAAGRLSRLARSGLIRDAAEELGNGLADDPNAMVALQLELGRLEAEREARKSSKAT